MVESRLSLAGFYDWADRLLYPQGVPGQRDGEELLIFARRHPFFLFRSLLFSLVPLVLALVFLTRANLWPLLLSPLAGFGPPVAALLCLLLALGLAFWAFLEWENDHYIVTTERVISIRRVYRVYEERREVEMDRLQDVTIRVPGLTGTLLAYGDLLISTAGALGTVAFSRVEQPQHVAETILRQREAAGRDRLESSRETVRETLQREMGIH